MNKRFITYMLIAVTITVWVIVFFRIFGRKEDVVIEPKREQRQTVTSKDTLLLNYRNPFLRVETVVVPKNIEVVEIIEAPVFTYKGLIKSKKGLFLMINDTIIRPKDKMQNYTITKVCNDSIRVRKGRSEFIIRRE